MLRVACSLTKEYRNDKLSRIHRLNENLDKLVNGVQFHLSFRKTHTKVVNAAEHYKRMRDHAKVIHDALKEKLEASVCRCNVCSIPLVEAFCPVTFPFADCHGAAPHCKSPVADEIF